MENDQQTPAELKQPLPRPYCSTQQWSTALQLGCWISAFPIVVAVLVGLSVIFSGGSSFHTANSIAESDARLKAFQLMAIGCIAGFCIALPYFGCLTLAYRKERHLVKWGIAVPARLVGKEEVATRYGNSTRLSYEFQTLDGSYVEGSRGGLPADNAFTFSAVDALMFSIQYNPTVLYDPQDYLRYLLYPPKYVEVSTI